MVRVTGGSNKRVPLAGLITVRPGQRPRLIYRVHRASRRGKKRKGFTETEYARLPDAAHAQPDRPLVVVWDNLNTHVSRAMTDLIAARGLADGLPAAAVRLRAEPGRERVVSPEEIPGQPGQT